MKTNKVIFVIAIIGILILFFFPEPEENFILYFGTMLFIGILISLIIKKNKNNISQK